MSNLFCSYEKVSCSVTNSLAETVKRWTPFVNAKHLSDQGKTSSTSVLYYVNANSSTDSDIPRLHTKTSNKQIHTVASFSSLTDTVKNAMQRGSLSTTTNQLRRPTTNAVTVSSNELNHLSPQSM